MNITLQQHCQLLPEGDTQTPIRLFMQIRKQTPKALLFESAEVDGRWGRYSLIATDYICELSCQDSLLQVDIHDPILSELSAYSGRPYMEAMRELLSSIEINGNDKDAPPITRAIYGYWGYEMATIFQPKLAKSIDNSAAESRLVIPATLLVFDHMYNKLYQLSIGTARDLSKLPELGDSQPKGFSVGETMRNPNEEKYMAGVESVRQLLHAGEAIQVVGSTQCSADFEGDTFELYRHMRGINPSPYMFYMHFDQLELFGASPEVMVQCSRNNLLLSPIAGTRRRGKSPAEDESLAEDMLADPKERAEHTMLVDLGRNDLGRVAKGGSVIVERLMKVEKFSHVMHMTSRVTAQLREDKDALDIIAASFPAGTVSGAPKLRAMEIISSIEDNPRGPYAGCIGWIGLDKDSVNLDTGITIRSMWKRGGKLYWQMGAGLVYEIGRASCRERV